VSLFKPKFVLLALALTLLPLALTSACSGVAFTNSGAGGSGGTGNVSSGGTASGVSCGGPEDCNDKDLCTADFCNGNGVCDASPICEGTQKCCGDGDCAECCEHQDCDDGVSCTQNKCFAGQCMYVPDDSQCESTQYCSVKDSCRAKQLCGIVPGEAPATSCEDGSACTTDSCVDNFCKNNYCAEGILCCPETGCADQCCNDSQCDEDEDKDPCTVGSCQDGKCSLKPLCGAGHQCCPSADRTTATCGTCCSALECDDEVACTDDKCTGGACSNHADSTKCGVGYACSPTIGCQRAEECTQDSQCAGSPCGKCVSGSCSYVCPGTSKCCPNGCATCCEDSECSDNIPCTKDHCGATGCSHTPDNAACGAGKVCDLQLGCVACRADRDCNDNSACTQDSCNQKTNTCAFVSTCGASGQVCNNGVCAQCLTAYDCAGGVITTAAPVPIGQCTYNECIDGTCKQTTTNCGDLGQCCSYGCGGFQGCFETQ